MGAYTTGAAVYQLLLDMNVGPPSRLTPEEIEPIITGIEAQVNGVLKAQGYAAVPATGTNDVAMIREQVRKKAATQVYVTLNQPQRSPDWVRTWDIDFSEWMNMLRQGQLRLVDQAPDVGQEGQVVVIPFRKLPMLPTED
ncbi:MAG: hypothetical protein JXO22_06460 [Phycisphaerae bacterium]|nr:hypothetical protein [Phycisphaerae bacterium]